MEINKIYNMDCLVGMKQMLTENQKVDCIITDPPYNIDINFVRKDGGKILNDNLSESDFENLLNEYFSLCYQL